MLPRHLKNFNLFVNGVGYAGKVTGVTLPTIKIKTEDHRAGGMDAPVGIDMGMEKLAGKFTLSDYDPATAKLLGALTANTPIVMRGAIQAQGEAAALPVVVKMTAALTSREVGELKSGDVVPVNFEYECNAYTEIIAGETVIDIDVVNMKRVINGVDQMQSIRTALGM